MLCRFLEALESGEKNAASLLAECLDRIARLDPELRAWVQVAPQPALGSGPLAGIPFGAKDIFETRGLADEWGTPLRAGRKGETDAALVTELRQLGAVLVGKTQTTVFASFDPSPTRNPRALDRTPGGSSSGSAAAVAAGMVPFALGSQTQGSVIRPASFCGVVGFKPTFGLLPLDGVMPFAPSLDTAGLFTQRAADMRALWQRMGRYRNAHAASAIGVLRQFADPLAQLRGAGIPAHPIDLPFSLDQLGDASRLINSYEGARTHRAVWEQHGEAMGVKLAALIAGGLQIPDSRYAAALDFVRAAKQQIAQVFAQTPILATPAAPGPPPLGLESTGDPRMNAPWTALGVPAISVPLPVDDRPPIGIQLVAASGEDSMLIETAVAVETRL
jgi:Asp-tRNA(Asn)/Glu-tRNA(Gln) amidotransferase A subunit family amidase